MGWFKEGFVCDQSLANEHQPQAFCWNIRDQTLFPLLSREDNNCKAGIHDKCQFHCFSGYYVRHHQPSQSSYNPIR